ncbi:MaoC family dehydratase [Natrarchaeobius halalkaliphilus]|uniref:MaoC family dehydratase n=1 Tax=Natrarchaeobius halalkaliphilus TaxID=1679091 RepID=A0A3N6P6B4_9EURY|nr:MaoC family dehydratase [Natrarchaeobius halalkaliphilus]RQG91285.1 MaoC family dehydratase [Natrarchaeobius halalkaliphilus]
MSQNTEGNEFAAVTNAWSEMTRSFIRSATAANRAALSAMVPAATENGSNGKSTPASVPSIDHSDLGWTFERTVDESADLDVGDAVTFDKRLTDEDVRAFAQISGDTNRLHLDDGFAVETRFGERIVHGTLVSGLISAALARLPGLTIYLSQDLEFVAPVGIEDRVSARAEIVEDLGNRQYRLETVVRNEDEDEVVIDGEAVVLIDDLPDDDRRTV